KFLTLLISQSGEPMRCTVTLLLVCGIAPWTAGADLPRKLLELRIGQERVEGMPLAWSEQRVYLLARDGRLWDFAPNAASEFHALPGSFKSYTPSVIRNQVQAELGRRYEVTGTGRYLVAHPAGQQSQWADRFENLYRSFVHYFSVRGFRVKDPEFP